MAVFGTSSVLGPGHRRLLRRPGLDRWASPAGAGSSTSTCRWASLAFVVVFRVLHLPHTRREHRIDWPGALALITFLVPLLIVAEQGRTWGWGSDRALLCYAIGAVGLRRLHPGRAGLQGRRPAAAADVQEPQLRGRAASAASCWAPACSAASCCCPQYLQIVHGSSPTVAGLQMIPLVAGHHDRRDGRRSSRSARPASTRSSRWSASCSSSPRWSRCRSSSTPTPRCGRLVPFMVLLGLGLGFNFQPVILAVQNAVSPAGDGRRHLVGDVLPADGRHDRGRGLPVDPVHRRCRTRSPTPTLRPERPRRSRRPLRRTPTRCAAAGAGGDLATRRSSRRIAGRWPRRSRPGSPTRSTWCSSWRPRSWRSASSCCCSSRSSPLRNQSGIQAAAGRAPARLPTARRAAEHAAGAAAPTSVEPPVDGADRTGDAGAGARRDRRADATGGGRHRGAARTSRPAWTASRPTTCPTGVRPRD